MKINDDNDEDYNDSKDKNNINQRKRFVKSDERSF